MAKGRTVADREREQRAEAYVERFSDQDARHDVALAMAENALMADASDEDGGGKAEVDELLPAMDRWLTQRPPRRVVELGLRFGLFPEPDEWEPVSEERA